MEEKNTGWSTPVPVVSNDKVGERWPAGTEPALSKDYGKTKDAPKTKTKDVPFT